VLHASLTSSSLISSPLWYLVKRTSYEGPHYVVFSSPPPPVISSLTGPKILISNPFSHTLKLWFFHTERIQISLPYRTTGKIIVETIHQE
jgi:hypothetical protein